MLTVNVGQRGVVLVFHEQVTELNFGRIDVLSCDEHLCGASASFRPSLGYDVPNLRRQARLENWELGLDAGRKCAASSERITANGSMPPGDSGSQSEHGVSGSEQTWAHQMRV